ncbi:MAG: HAMP domain-containing histidine kinase [Burkholderiales bacterium]|nr:HAMP domain-containing histidine kinase [Burkholderiales bacterium]
MPPSEAHDEPVGVLLAALFSALSHDMRTGINGIGVWTHILERLADPTAARAVEGIRRSIIQQSDLAQEISDFGREVFAAAGEAPCDMVAVIREAPGDPQSGIMPLPVQMHLPTGPLIAAVPVRALRMLLRLLLRDAFATLSADGTLEMHVIDDSEGDCWQVCIDTREPGGLYPEAHTRRPLRQTLALLGAHAHGLALELTSARRCLHLPRAADPSS